MLCTCSISRNRFVAWDKTRKRNHGMAERNGMAVAKWGKNAEWRKRNGDKMRNGGNGMGIKRGIENQTRNN